MEGSSWNCRQFAVARQQSRGQDIALETWGQSLNPRDTPTVSPELFKGGEGVALHSSSDEEKKSEVLTLS